MNEDLRLHEPFERTAQQRSADFMGMYIFLGTEIMLFGGLFATVLAYRILHPEAVAEASRHLKLWLGGANTAILLTSSLFMALAVQASRRGERRAGIGWLLATAVLGIAFLGVKGYEYYTEYMEGLMPHVGQNRSLPGLEWLFINIYYCATGLHAFHLTMGVLVVLGLAIRFALGWTPLPRHAVTVEMVGLYWHLVDVVWVFLYPVLYLAR